MNVQSMECTPDYARIVAVDGSVWTVTRAELEAAYHGANPGFEHAAAQAHAKASAKAALGDYIEAPFMDIEFDPDDPTAPITVTLRSA